MSFSHEYNFPIFVSTGSIATSGHSGDLKIGQLGVFDAKTYTAVSGAIPANKALFLAQGSWHTKDKLAKYTGGLTQSDKTIEFLGKDILGFERSLPRKAVAEQWIVGWDGTNDCGSLTFECGKSYRFKVKVWGEDVYGTFLHPLEREVMITTDCCTGTDCDEVCSDAVGAKKWGKLIAKTINEDPELKYFVKADTISSDYSTTTSTNHLYSISVCDTGDQIALSTIQGAFASLTITRKDRVGSTSIYETVTVDSPAGTAVAPSNYTPVGANVPADCNTCPAGYTLVLGSQEYIISTPLDGSEDLNDSTARQTFSDALALAYFPAATFNGASDVEVVASSDAITLTGHALVTGEKVLYSNGGGTTVVGLTNSTNYYVIKVDANTVKLATTAANALAGTAIAISDGVGAAHTLTPVIAATFLSQNGASASVKVLVPAAIPTLGPLLADTVVAGASFGAICTPAALSAIAWVVGDPRYRTTRTLCVTVPKDCGGNSRLADVQAALANDTSIVSGTIAIETVGDCADTYTLDQYSDNLLDDGCLSEDVPVYRNPQSFEGFVWADCPCTSTSNPDDGTKVGVRLTAAYEDTKFGGCSFSPVDYYSVRPLRLEVTVLVGGPGVDNEGSPCVSPVPSRRTRFSSMSTQSGEWLLRELIKANQYRVHGEFYADPRLREALDSMALKVVDRKKSYVTYHLKVRQNRLYQNHNGDYSPEIYEFVIAFPEAVSASTFELLVEGVTSQFGVYLENR